MRDKLIELIGSTEYGKGSLVGNNFQRGFVEKIADHLIANGVTIQKWIPVTERLPKPYGDVITLRQDLLSENWHAVGLEYITLHGDANIPVWSKDHMTWKNKVTHWMPLPEPPKGE